jgi:hypothetical protein
LKKNSGKMKKVIQIVNKSKNVDTNCTNKSKLIKKENRKWIRAKGKMKTGN